MNSDKREKDWSFFIIALIPVAVALIDYMSTAKKVDSSVSENNLILSAERDILLEEIAILEAEYELLNDSDSLVDDLTVSLNQLEEVVSY